MELTVLFCLSGLVLADLIPDWPVTPDDEEVWELLGDSLAHAGQHSDPELTRYRWMWRVKTDSLKGGLRTLGSFLRLQLKQQRWAANLVMEKDPGEPEWADFWGAGMTLRHGDWRFTAGDYTIHSGLGLMLASPAHRSGFRYLELPPDEVLLRSAQENRHLRGGRVDRQFRDRLLLTAAVSHTRRDARLNPDGSVARMLYSGIHRDSATLAAKGTTDQLFGGTVLQLRLSDECRAGLTVGGIRYNRNLAPEETLYSFSGQSLAGGSVFWTLGRPQRGGEFEVARSFPGGFAGAGRVRLRERGWNVVLNCLITGNRFYAPLGRAPSLTNRRARGQLNGRLGWQGGGLAVQVDGNTYFDYLEDSIPARIGINARYRHGGFRIDLKTTRKFRHGEEQRHESRIDLELRKGPVEGHVYAGDEYLATAYARGQVLGLNLQLNLQAVELAMGAAIGSVQGSGVSISVPEPGVTPAAASFRFGCSAVRLAVLAETNVGRKGRLRIKTGLTRHQRWEQDWAMQLELTN